MLVAHYIGDHAKDGISARLGWWIIRAVQRGEFKNVTHCEAILGGDKNACQIASASLRDDGVRTKTAALTPGNWRIFDVPQFSAAQSARWFKDHDGEGYSVLGAMASPFSFLLVVGQFCSRAVAESAGVLGTPLMPHAFAAMCATFGTEVTDLFFKDI